MDPRPLILTARFDTELFEILDRLRGDYFPPERNFLPAHLTLFHHLPGAELETVRADLGPYTRLVRFECSVTDLKFTGRGMQIAIECEALLSVRQNLADRWRPWLTPQDRQKYRPHVTLQNKVDPAVARGAFDRLRSEWFPKTGWVVGLNLWHYAGGPWEPAGRFDFEAPI